MVLIRYLIIKTRIARRGRLDFNCDSFICTCRVVCTVDTTIMVELRLCFDFKFNDYACDDILGIYNSYCLEL